jgi:DNA-binding GntR family transcriptional regulator
MRATERAYAWVREGILESSLGAGSRLTEQELAAAVGVSRTPIREALRRLHAEGLVHFEPNHGAIVASFESSDAEEIFELRAVLEPLGARRAALHATAAEIAEMHELAEKQMHESVARGSGFLTRIGDLNDRFHRLIQQASNSQRLVKSLSGILEAPLILRTFREYTAVELRRSADQHLELVQALQARDAEWAHSIMHAHIMTGKGTYLRSRNPK